MNVLNIDNPFGAKYHRAQAEYLRHAIARKARHAETAGNCGIQYLHYRGGRGCGKTTVGIMDMVQVAFVDMPGPFRTCWTEPTHGDIDRVLLRELEQIVPRNLWHVVNKAGGYRYIQWSSGHTTDLIPRFVSNSNRRPSLGSNLSGVFHDEAAANFDPEKFASIEDAIRAPNSPYLFVSTFSTPWPGGYSSYVREPGSILVEASSYDNPHLTKAVIDSRVARMSKDRAAREIFGQDVALEGRIWKDFVEEPFPRGNIVDGMQWKASEPWWLSVDLGGSQSAAQVWQRYDNGRSVVCVEEWTPNQMHFEELLSHIVKRYCDGNPKRNAPQRVYIGHDVRTADSIGGTSAAKLLSSKAFGWNWTYPAGQLGSKDLQRYHAANLLHQRKVLVAALRNNRGEYEQTGLHMNDHKTRCLLRCMLNDVYGPIGGDDLQKDKKRMGVDALEDVRDAFLYMCICRWHPDEMKAQWYKETA